MSDDTEIFVDVNGSNICGGGGGGGNSNSEDHRNDATASCSTVAPHKVDDNDVTGTVHKPLTQHGYCQEEMEKQNAQTTQHGDRDFLPIIIEADGRKSSIELELHAQEPLIPATSDQHGEFKANYDKPTTPKTKKMVSVKESGDEVDGNHQTCDYPLGSRHQTCEYCQKNRRGYQTGQSFLADEMELEKFNHANGFFLWFFCCSNGLCDDEDGDDYCGDCAGSGRRREEELDCKCCGVKCLCGDGNCCCCNFCVGCCCESKGVCDRCGKCFIDGCGTMCDDCIG